MRNERDGVKCGGRVSGIIEMAKACKDIHTLHRSLGKGRRTRQGEDKPNSLEGRGRGRKFLGEGREIKTLKGNFVYRGIWNASHMPRSRCTLRKNLNGTYTCSSG